MDYKVEYTEKSQRDLARLDKAIARRILIKLDFFIEQEDPLSFAKELKNTQEEHWRFRIGDYRVIFRLDRATKRMIILVILKITHRKENL